MQKIIGVRRAGDKEVYFFLQTFECEIGTRVVVDFDEFLTIATVVKTDVEVDDLKATELKKIVRIADEKDVKKFDTLKKKATDSLVMIKRKSLELGLMMKFVDAEYSLDGSKVVIVFSSEERVDFRQFLKSLASMLKTRIELRQIGQRDEIKIVGGVGPCGQPCCCSRFLKDFEHVTVKMAKIQGLSLSPTKINGICGRLMCCLGYESKTYEEILSRMPKIGQEIKLQTGKGTVVYNDILRERVSIKRVAEGDTFVVEDFALDEIDMQNMCTKVKVSQTGKQNENKALVIPDILSQHNDAKKDKSKPSGSNRRESGERENNNRSEVYRESKSFGKKKFGASSRETHEKNAIAEKSSETAQNKSNAKGGFKNHKKPFHKVSDNWN